MAQVPITRAVVGIEVPFACASCGFQSTVKVAATAEAHGDGIDSGERASEEALARAKEEAPYAKCPKCGAQKTVERSTDTVRSVLTSLGVGGLGAGLVWLQTGSAVGASLVAVVGAVIGFAMSQAGRARPMSKVVDPDEELDGQVSCTKCQARVEKARSYIADRGPVCEACFNG